MKIDRKKTYLAMAKACKDTKDLEAAGLKRGTFGSAFDKELRPATVGRIAKAIGCSVEYILADEEL